MLIKIDCSFLITLPNTPLVIDSLFNHIIKSKQNKLIFIRKFEMITIERNKYWLWSCVDPVTWLCVSSSLDGRLSALPSLVFDESRQKVDWLKSMRWLLSTSMQGLHQSFSSKVLNCRLSVDLLPSLESNEGKAESRLSKVGLSVCAFTLTWLMSFLQTLNFHCFRWLKEKNSTWKSLTINQVRVYALP